MDFPERFASPPSRPEAPLTGFLTQPRPLPDPSAFSMKLEKRRRSDMSDADNKTKAAVLECPEKPTKSPPLSRVFITRAAHHVARARFLWADPDIFPERRTLRVAISTTFYISGSLLTRTASGGADGQLGLL